MSEKLFSWKQLMLVVIATILTTIGVMREFVSTQSGEKYALLDKEAVVADYVFSTPDFSDEDRAKVLDAIDAVQKKYTDQGYLVIEKTSCTSGDSSIVLSAAPETMINITPELRQRLAKDKGND